MLSNLFNEVPSSPRVQSFLQEVALRSKINLSDPDIKTYPDAVYFNYYELGVSLMFVTTHGRISTTLPVDYETLSLDGIDIFNNASTSLSKARVYSQFPLLPMEFELSNETPAVVSNPKGPFQLRAETTGQDFVQALGEPSRKGGGAGPSSGSISIWCEWSKHGIMVEFGGDQARGPQAWERGKDAIWKVVTLFPPKGP
ncbi:hypothetical protein K439DRAFT_1627749 [Ramaria rubella]|nr:hypothetical protein K439DRAFT_1627749 [Ramaria rubella]